MHGSICRCFARERLNFSGVWLIATLLINPTILISFAVFRCPGVQKEDGRRVDVCYPCIFSLHSLFYVTVADQEVLSGCTVEHKAWGWKYLSAEWSKCHRH